MISVGLDGEPFDLCFALTRALLTGKTRREQERVSVSLSVKRVFSRVVWVKSCDED